MKLTFINSLFSRKDTIATILEELDIKVDLGEII